jgi:hypothetical protein
VTVVVPAPVPLDLPPGEPQALDELVERVSAACFCLGVLETALTGPAGSAPGWHGDDASTAVAQVAGLIALAREGSGALRTAAGRIAAHRDLLTDVRRRIGALVAQQDDDHAAAWGRLGRLGGWAGCPIPASR